jgi:hypothetical protein
VKPGAVAAYSAVATARTEDYRAQASREEGTRNEADASGLSDRRERPNRFT